MRLFPTPFYQALQGDGGAETAPAATEPVAVEPAAADGGADPEPAIAEPAAPAISPAERAALLATITGLRAKNREIDDRAARAEQAARDAQALADRLAKGDKPDPVPQTPQRASAAQDDDAAVNARAEYLLYRRDAAAVGERLSKQFGQQRFNDAVNLLSAATTDNGDDMLRSIMAVDKDNAHLLLNELSQNPERIISLANMDPARRISELTRMAIAAAPAAKVEPAAAAVVPAKAAPAKTVSKAPAPAPALVPSASKVRDWATINADPNTTDEEWNKAYAAHQAERDAIRRRA